MKSLVFFCLVASAFGGTIRLMRVPRLDGRIVGGTDASIEKYPYQLSLQTLGKHDCGASIISKSWVLTATHCLHSTDPSFYSIRAGSSIRDSGGVVYLVKKVVLHEDWNEKTNDNDIALIQIEGEFDIGNNQQIIALPKMGENIPDGTVAVVTGWGSTSSKGIYSTVLQEVMVPIMSQESCKSAYGASITDNMVCAGYTEGGRDSCQGDSGGPMVINGEQVGVVSWGIGCALPGYPGVYARVASFREWISVNSGA